ncbi:MAG: urea transporter, partial [Cyclobacteriaceae bacterium]
MIRELRFWTGSTLNSYSQVFFSSYTWFGAILLIMSFLEPSLGLSGLLIVILTNLLAAWFGFDRSLIRRGDYGFNALLTGLGLGAYYELNLPFFVLLV